MFNLYQLDLFLQSTGVGVWKLHGWI